MRDWTEIIPHVINGAGLGLIAGAFGWPLQVLLGLCLVAGGITGTIQAAAGGLK